MCTMHDAHLSSFGVGSTCPLRILLARSESVGESSGDVIRPHGNSHNRVTVCTTYFRLVGVALRANELAVKLRSQAKGCRAK
jgi:hypothetical protein